MWYWQDLVQVCERWQQIIYSSPQYLDLHLHCSGSTSSQFREIRDRWPAFPLILYYWIGEDDTYGVQEDINTALISLQLEHIPLSSYISPQAMVQSLAGLTKLETLGISFFILSHEVNDFHQKMEKHLREASNHAVLPALTVFRFDGISRYLEDLVAQIDAPRLDVLAIDYDDQGVQTRQLSQFIDRTVNFKSAQFRRAELTCDSSETKVELYHVPGEGDTTCLSLSISDFRSRYSSLSHMANLLGRLVAFLSNVDYVFVTGLLSVERPPEGLDWLSLLRQFSAVEVLRVRKWFAGYVASALEATSEEMVPALLPALQEIWLDAEGGLSAEEDTEDNQHEDKPVPVVSIERFVSLRQLSGRPVTIVKSHDDEFVARLNARQSGA